MLITQTPLRISLFGGGTDFPEYFRAHGGCVISTTINKFVYVILKPRFDRKIVVGYTKTETVDAVDEIEHDLIREALCVTDAPVGLEIATMADIPSRGSGLGSSSSICVGALHALHSLQGDLVSAETLAQQAYQIEGEILGRPVGVQDQYAAAYGGVNVMEFGRNGAIRVRPADISPNVIKQLDRQLLLFFTGITRQSHTVLTEQKKNIAANRAVLGAMCCIATTAMQRLREGRIAEIGALLHESWLLKKSLATHISSPRLDEMYHRAMAAGAIGGKISGAGGGGFMLLLCPPDKQAAVRDTLGDYQELPFSFNHFGSRIMLNTLNE